MSGFSVTFDPPIPAATRRHELDVKKINWGRVHEAAKAAGLPELDPVYTVAGRKFGYYPADADVVLADMLRAADCFGRRINHDMMLCGYTVLLVEFRDERAFFSDPAGSYPSGGAPLGDGFDADEATELLRRAADAVWEFVFPEGPAASRP